MRSDCRYFSSRLDLWHPVTDYWKVPAFIFSACRGGGLDVCAAPMGMLPACGPGVDMLASWAEGLGQSRAGVQSRECLRFAFYGRVSTEDWQDPVTSRARQLQQAVMLTAGHGTIVAQFFDTVESRTLPWARRPQAAALVAQLADPDRGWDAIVIGEYERAFYGNQYASMAPLFEHYGIQLWMPEVGGRVDWHAEDHEQTMLALGLSSKREITRTRIRVRTAMATQTREQGRYLGGRPPYGYRLADAGPHPNKAHAAWGRGAPRPRRSSLIPGIRGGRCGTGSALTSTWPTRRTPRWAIRRCIGGTCPEAGSSPNIPRTRRWSARQISSPPRTAPRRAAPPGPRHAGTCWPGCWPAGSAEGGWNQRGPTASPPTGAATATPAPPAQNRDGPRTPTYARTRSSRTLRPSPSSSPAPPGNLTGRTAAWRS